MGLLTKDNEAVCILTAYLVTVLLAVICCVLFI